MFFKGNESLVKCHGKGAGEFEIMNYIIQNSKLIKTVSSFVKITGRIEIRNLSKIIRKCKNNRNYFQIHYPRYKEKYVETVFYKIKLSDFKKFTEIDKLVNDSKGIYYEHVIYKQLVNKKIKFYYFPVYPIIRGISGSTGGLYDEKKSVLFYIKGIMSRFGLLGVYYYFAGR